MDKGQKCLAFTVFEDKPVWVCGNIHDILEMKTQKVVVVAVRKDYQRLVGGNGVITIPPYFCYPTITAAGEALNAMGQGLDKFVANHIPDSEVPPLILDAQSTAFHDTGSDDTQVQATPT